MTSTLRLVLLLSAVCAAFCYRSPVKGGGSYTLPNIGKYPAPQPTFPRNHGLPDAYKNRHLRSVDDQHALINGQLAEEPAVKGPVDKALRHVRPEGKFLEDEPSLVDDQAELKRLQRSPQLTFIQPTYRPSSGYSLIHPTYRTSSGYSLIHPTYRPSRTSGSLFWL